MNSRDLLKLKGNTENVILSEKIICDILDKFSKSNIKTFKNAKKHVSVLKNNTIHIKKDLNENKLVMIMNKISSNNINELLKEYLENIAISSIEMYESIQNVLLIKMLKDITFITNYCQFALKIFIVEKYRQSHYPSYFINQINSMITTNYINCANDNETDRL